jgi:hypothetical protein
MGLTTHAYSRLIALGNIKAMAKNLLTNIAN